ncbi:hypothetical protein EB118_20525, partial [bacterium]|nr:hypothetical protein [bacterium]
LIDFRIVDSVSMFIDDRALDDMSIRNQLIEQNVTITPTGCMFDRDYQGFLPRLMQTMYNDRSEWKKRMLEAKKKYELNPTEELRNEIARCQNMQQAKKIQLNSVYGGLSNVYFRWFDPRLAESITKAGQLSIRWMERKINEYLNKLFKTTGEDYVISCDTDSVVGDTLIWVDGVKMKISDYYDSCTDFLVEDKLNQNFVKRANKSNITRSFNIKDGVKEREIKYVMKHKVKKRMYKITSGEKSVIVTEDHSICVERDGVLIDVSPVEMKPTDRIIINT